MADNEDYAEFGSHFLDSMLEVEMTEEDNELDVAKNDDLLNTLPPIPTFDLHSETISYKDACRNAMPQPVLTSLPIGTSSACNVPVVLKPSSMVIYSGETPPAKPVVSNVYRTRSKPLRTNAVKFSSPDVKPLLSNSQSCVDSSNISSDDGKFKGEVFKREFVKNVFNKADPPWDIALVSDEEMKYYKTCFKDVSKVQLCKLHCTICDKHIGCAVKADKKLNVHTMLKVLTCKPCFEFYGDGNFPCDQKDNCEIYCRWCGQGGALVCCSFCPSVFCKKCVRRNYGLMFLKSIEKASDWACFCCAQKPLWPHRAICRALIEFIGLKKTDPKISPKDTSSCCSVAGLTRKRLRVSGAQPNLQTQPEEQEQSKPEMKSRPGPGRKALYLKPVVQLKPTDKIKPSVSFNGNSKPNVFSSKSIFTGNNIIRGITTNAPTKFFSSLPPPQLMSTPVIHGETVITPPSRFLVSGKPSPIPFTPPKPPQSPAYVRVSLTHQTANLDMSKLPTVKVPHDVQGLVLRLIFPDNKMHYVKLAPDGTGCKASKEFPMPQFREQGASFVDKNLAEGFKISKVLYERLMRVREKVNSRSKFTEESVFNSSVKKLHAAYEKTMELLQELDKSLLEGHEEWKNGAKNSVDVIYISDDEGTAAKKSRPGRPATAKEKCKKLGEDSDVEILDDVVMNGKPPASNNYKEKYRLKTQVNNKVAVRGGRGRRRKRGRVRKELRKLETETETDIGSMENGEPEEDPLATDVPSEDTLVDEGEMPGVEEAETTEAADTTDTTEAEELTEAEREEQEEMSVKTERET